MPGIEPDLRRQYEFVMKQFVDWKCAKSNGPYYLDEFDEAVESLVYVIGFCQKNGFALNADMVKGILMFILSQQSFFKIPDNKQFHKCATLILAISIGKTN